MFLGNISNFALLGCHYLTILSLLIAGLQMESVYSCTEDILSARRDVLAFAQEMSSIEIISAPLSKKGMLTSGDTLAYTSSINYMGQRERLLLVRLLRCSVLIATLCVLFWEFRTFQRNLQQPCGVQLASGVTLVLEDCSINVMDGDRALESRWFTEGENKLKDGAGWFNGTCLYDFDYVPVRIRIQCEHTTSISCHLRT